MPPVVLPNVPMGQGCTEVATSGSNQKPTETSDPAGAGDEEPAGQKKPGLHGKQVVVPPGLHCPSPHSDCALAVQYDPGAQDWHTV